MLRRIFSVLMFAGCAAAAAAGTGADTDVEMLQRLWPGVRDSSEQMIVNTDRGAVGWIDSVERRARTIVAPIELPWLGDHVLYLEEFLQDEPDQLRRQLVLQLKPQGPPEAAVRVHLFTFKEPGRWMHLDRRMKLAQGLQKSDLAAVSGCDLVLVREGGQFRGGTVGQECRSDRRGAARPDAARPDAARYVDYQLVIGEELYWYRRRVLRRRDDRVSEELMGYNWFELNESQLFSCRIDWSATGRAADLRPLLRLDLQDEGGRGRFTTPDGRALELTMHNQDWPYSRERDALILVLRAQGSNVPLSSAWAQVDLQRISLETNWLRVRCGSLAPDSDELSGALDAPAFRYPAAEPG